MGLDDDALTARLELACSAAREAGQLTLQYFRSAHLDVELKADDSPVTVADREAELLLRRRVQAEFPNDAVVGEEFGHHAGTSGFRWIFDPIDGTRAFISGVPLYGTMIGVEYEQRSVIGVIDMPALDEHLYAAQGRGAWYAQGDAPARAARVSSRERLIEGLFVTTQIDLYERRDALQVFWDLQRRAANTRTWGDCYGYLLVATGRAEVMLDPEMSIWDAAALQPILEEAGGTFTDWQGNRSIHHGEGIGTNGRVLDEVLDVTRPYTAGR